MSYDKGFTLVEKFFLWALGMNGFVFLFGAFDIHKRHYSKGEALLEGGVNAAAIHRKKIQIISIFVSLFISLLVWLKWKILTWIVLVGANLVAMVFWGYLWWNTRTKGMDNQNDYEGTTTAYTRDNKNATGDGDSLSYSTPTMA